MLCKSVGLRILQGSVMGWLVSVGSSVFTRGFSLQGKDGTLYFYSIIGPPKRSLALDKLDCFLKSQSLVRYGPGAKRKVKSRGKTHLHPISTDTTMSYTFCAN